MCNTMFNHSFVHSFMNLLKRNRIMPEDKEINNIENCGSFNELMSKTNNKLIH